MYRLGCLWGLLSLVALAVLVLGVAANSDVVRWMGSWPPSKGLVSVLQLMYFPQLYYLLFFLIALSFGLVGGLLNRKSWARVVSIAVCYLVMAYVLAGYIIALALPSVFSDQLLWFTLITLWLLGVLGLTARHLSSRASVKAFAQEPAQKTCPQCGSSLDQQGTCPQCTANGKVTPAWLKTAEGGFIPLNNQRMIVGREEDCDIPVNDPTVSHEHAEVHYKDGGWFITDRESSNGVVINGTKVKASPLKDGDEVLLGQVKLVFKSKKG